ncbi:hypothetical protein TWF481_008729 [Arthrobotrys musiformis]|uniref:DUF7918 domain-containing protein n=1 Tax=Arthrobotrys musiformis TaxID=47236 RepID=A0AAV9WAE8_9PEZI
MPTHNSVTCDLYIEGVRAVEHSATTEDATCTVWIVAEENKKYSFNIDVSETGAAHHRVQFWADGISLENYRLRSTTVRIDKVKLERSASGDTTYGSLAFGKLGFSDDDFEARTETRNGLIKEIGSLKLSIWRFQYGKSYESKHYHPFKRQSVKPVKEDLLKGKSVSHCTQFHEIKTKYKGSRTCHDSKPIDPIEKPLATFIFNYASKALLQAEGYIPRTPSPEIIDEDLSDLTNDELRREIMRLRGNNVDLQHRVKQEHDTDTKRKMKQEGGSRSYVDLTLDDD